MNADEPVVFGPAVEGLKRALGARLDVSVTNQLRALGIDLDHVLVAYPADAFVQALVLVGDALAAEFPPERRYVELGRLFMRGFVETGLGRAAAMAGKVVGVRRTLLRMGRNFKTGSNYLETEFTEVGPTELLLRTWVEPRYLPRISERSTAILDYRRGILEEVLAQLNAQGSVEVVAQNIETREATFRVAWR